MPWGDMTGPCGKGSRTGRHKRGRCREESDEIMGMVKPVLGAGIAIQMLPLLKKP